MLQIGNTLISLDLLEQHFVCDLIQCKGACCIEGDAGAPLTNEELSLIENIIDEVKPFMAEEGVKAIKKAKYTIDEDGEPVTQLVKGKQCAYMVYEKNGSTKCAFEIAFQAGKTNFKKPISCHLYPVRISQYKDYLAVNYHEWDICKSACECGEKLKTKVYRFLKEPLIRKFGKDWYQQLEEAAALHESGANKFKV